MPAILDEITGRKLNFLRDSRPHFGNETSQIASAHIGHHNDTPLAVLAVDHFSRTADINSSQQTSALDFAVSNTSDPTQGFTEMHKINTKESVALLPQNAGKTFFSDFPRMGWNADAITFTFNMFTFPLSNSSAYDHVQVLTIKKSTATDANNGTIDTFTSDRSGLSNSTMVPAVMHGAASGLPVIFAEEKLDATGPGLLHVNVYLLDQ